MNLLDYIKAANAALFKNNAVDAAGKPTPTAPTTGPEQAASSSGWFAQILKLVNSSQWSPPGWFPANWGQK
jgi:hypothetical protein